VIRSSLKPHTEPNGLFQEVKGLRLMDQALAKAGKWSPMASTLQDKREAELLSSEERRVLEASDKNFGAICKIADGS
jgi:hypothetical protein